MHLFVLILYIHLTLIFDFIVCCVTVKYFVTLVLKGAPSLSYIQQTMKGTKEPLTAAKHLNKMRAVVKKRVKCLILSLVSLCEF